ncbi:hypothetical protein L6250_02240 [Candidatus Parcubacteria bacterium]|nr:hypothetical protein [Candidatus Parcubacteria bacterium]
MLKAFKIEISQSCEGHIEKEEVSPPWIEIYPTEPEREDWTGDEELRSSVEKEGKEMRLKILNLLNEFYEQEKVPFDQMLGFKNVGYGFRIQNNGAETLGLLDKKIQEEKVEIYKTEIERLTQFLKDKYFEKPELKPEQVLPKRKEIEKEKPEEKYEEEILSEKEESEKIKEKRLEKIHKEEKKVSISASEKKTEIPEKIEPEFMEKEKALSEKEIRNVVKILRKEWKDFKKAREFKKGEIITQWKNEIFLPQVPEIPSKSVPKVIRRFLEKFEKEKDKEKDMENYFGYFVSSIINKTVREYVSQERKKGKEHSEIEHLSFRLHLEDFKEPFSHLGYRNQEKCYLSIYLGKTGKEFHSLGEEMEGGDINVHGDVGYAVGARMCKGDISVEGNAGNSVGTDMGGGELSIRGDAGPYVARGMKRGKLSIGGYTSFDNSAFSSDNKGEIWHKWRKIWPSEEKGKIR